MITKSQVEALLKTFVDPYLNSDWITAQAVRDIDISPQKITLDVHLGYPLASQLLLQQAQYFLQEKLNNTQVEINLAWKIEAHATQPGMKTCAEIKNIIAVASGKGGVGKSTVAVNLALALNALGATVGLLDADIYGPSQPLMLGIQEKPASTDGKHMEPIVKYGIQVMSIGFLIEQATAMVWRGPMVSMALQQLLNDTHWHNLDYLIIDLPPGTGDIQLTLAQKIPVSGSVIVTTPQDIALLDARKAIEMFKKVRIPVLGVVENMSTYHCPQCGHVDDIFGSQGGERLASDYQVDLLGQLPLSRSLREQVDQGKPPVVSEPAGQFANLYQEIALKVSGRMAIQAKNYGTKFPKITIETN